MGKVLVIGSINYDISIKTNRIPKCGETILGESIRFNCGGKGINQSYACGLSDAETSFIGCIGDDMYGTSIMSELKNIGISTEFIKKVDCPTGIAVISVDKEGNNSIIATPGANKLLSVKDIENSMELFMNTDIVLIQNEIPVDVNEKIIELSHQLSKLIIYNPAPFVPINPSLYQYIDYITPNETELNLLIECNGNILEKALMLKKLGVKNVIVTRGSDDLIHVDEKGAVKKYPVRKVDSIDTVGAGDCLNGYFAGLVSCGYTIEKAIKAAIEAASLSCTKEGTLSSMPYLKDVLLKIEGD